MSSRKTAKKKGRTRLHLALAALPLAGAAAFYLSLPDVRPLRESVPETTAFMRLAEAQAKKKKRPFRLEKTWVPLDRISPNLIHAVLLSEDAAFYRHHGVDWEAVRLAMERNWKARRAAYGASTLTQQLAKNLYLSPSKNPLRKLKEYFITKRLERALPKKRILELYLNLAQWGDGLYGAEAAARRYFHKPASELSPEEAAALATALPSPRKLPPDHDSRYLSRARRSLLSKMRAAGYLPPEAVAASTATAEEVWPPGPAIEEEEPEETEEALEGP